MPRSVRLLPALLALSTLMAPSGRAIEPWSENPWYWSHNGEPVLLVGGSDDDNLFQWPDERLGRQLDRLVAAGGNVVRNTMSDRRDGRDWEVYAFARRDDGRYDLTRFNPEYWRRFERFLGETARRGVFVQIEVWDRFDFTDLRQPNWQSHPFNPKNNVNYGYEESGFAERYDKHPGRNEQPFFFTTPEQRDNSLVLGFQQRFVDRLLEASLAYDHVLYCIDNETSGDPAWGRYWARYLREQARGRGESVAVTEMWDSHDLRSDEHRQTFDHPDLYTFVDVSQNNHKSGQQHWDNFLFVRGYLAARPRPMNTTKTYGADGNKFGHSDRDGVERFWRHLLAGAASVRFHRPPSGLGLSDKALASIRAARLLEERVPLWTVEPDNSLLADREPNEAYLAAAAGERYALFATDGGQFALDLSPAPGAWKFEWIDIDRGVLGPAEHVEGGRSVSLSPPGDGPWAAAVTQARADP
ncbi:hypothetical protein [Botrimarina sp.]|uniref:hypothetical protein n=1 Tax=Botrimarina sp. TaxID=2795802 RepID=UPI0032EAA02D